MTLSTQEDPNRLAFIFIRAASSGRVVAQLRKYGEETWGIPGGYTNKCESFIDAVIREAYEETGILVSDAEEIINGYDTQKREYHIYFSEIPDEVTLIKCNESQKLRWVNPLQWPSPSHSCIDRQLSALNNFILSRHHDIAATIPPRLHRACCP